LGVHILFITCDVRLLQSAIIFIVVYNNHRIVNMRSNINRNHFAINSVWLLAWYSDRCVLFRHGSKRGDVIAENGGKWM